jgi:hypothetical protein
MTIYYKNGFVFRLLLIFFEIIVHNISSLYLADLLFFIQKYEDVILPFDFRFSKINLFPK